MIGYGLDGPRGVSNHPADRIRTTSLLMLVGLALIARDVIRIRGWAGQARSIERDVRQRHARQLADVHEQHLQRIRDIRDELATPPAPAPAVDLGEDAGGN
jgi:hypothetical protein